MNTTHKLVEQYVPMANKLAYQKKRVLPGFVDIEELQSAAYLGLVEAASRYDITKGVSFSTFAYPRIFGAIHDWLREQGWGKRGENLKVYSLDATVDDSNECTLKDTIEAAKDNNHKEFLEHVSKDLDNQAEDILRYYFIDSHSMREIGEKFGVSESRVSQLIKGYKDRIRENCDHEELWEMAA